MCSSSIRFSSNISLLSTSPTSISSFSRKWSSSPLLLFFRKPINSSLFLHYSMLMKQLLFNSKSSYLNLVKNKILIIFVSFPILWILINSNHLSSFLSMITLHQWTIQKIYLLSLLSLTHINISMKVFGIPSNTFSITTTKITNNFWTSG